MPTWATGSGRFPVRQAPGPAAGGGFTLLEVVVAVALLGLVLTALVEGFTRGAGLFAELAGREALGMAAANQAALLAAGTEPGTSGLGEDFSLRWRWTPPSGSGADAGGLGRLTVSRPAPQTGRETSFTLYAWTGGDGGLR